MKRLPGVSRQFTEEVQKCIQNPADNSSNNLASSFTQKVGPDWPERGSFAQKASRGHQQRHRKVTEIHSESRASFPQFSCNLIRPMRCAQMGPKEGSWHKWLPGFTKNTEKLKKHIQNPGHDFCNVPETLFGHNVGLDWPARGSLTQMASRNQHLSRIEAARNVA